MIMGEVRLMFFTAVLRGVLAAIRKVILAVTFLVVLMAHAAQAEYEASPFANLRARPDFAFMRLHNLVDDGQAKAGSTFEIRLKRLEDFFCLLRIDTGAGVGKTHLPIGTALSPSHGEADGFFCFFFFAGRIFRGD